MKDQKRPKQLSDPIMCVVFVNSMELGNAIEKDEGVYGSGT